MRFRRRPDQETAMKAKRLWNERTRLILIMELAIVLPAAVLVILSATHLKHIQRDRGVEALFQREFTEALAISEERLNHKAYELMDDVRKDFPAPGNACIGNLDKVLAAHPYVAHVFLFTPEHGIIFRSQPYRLEQAGFHQEADYLSTMFAGWLRMDFPDFSEKLLKMEKKGSPYAFEPNWTPRGDKRLYQSVAVFRVVDERTGAKALGGIVFEAEYLRDQFFPQMLNEVMSRSVAEAQTDKNAVMMVHAKSESNPFAACDGWDGGTPEVERNLEAVFPGLVLGIKLRGTTLAAIGQHFFRSRFLTLAGLSLVLACGIALTYRNVSKEMALARLKSDFVSNVSHELRTPLSLIRLYAETLEMGRLTSPEKYQEYYCIIRKESERLTALINNILDFSRIEAGRKEYDFRDTDIAELVRNTLDAYRYQIEQQGFAFEQSIDSSIPRVRVDREAIARALVNLVNNALKYSANEKFLGVKLYRINDRLKLEVVDRGIGITRREQSKIFEKFYRTGDPLVHNTKGSGLGLSLVRHITQAHGGEVQVESTPGKGSKFTLSLPLATATQ